MAISILNRTSFFLISILFFTLTVFGQTRPLSELTAGEYPKLVNVLGAVSYRPETLQKLSHPTLIYADLDWLKEKNYDVPAKMNPSFEKQLLDVLAYAKRLNGEPKQAFTNETVTFYSEFYGGDEAGMNGNLGSGRASSKGEIQTKGVGPTSMVNRAKTDEEHSTGTMGLYEGLMEVLGSQIAHQELPYGANRIIALIATGTKTKDGEMRVLSVREDPLRPAHFIINETKANLVREKNRMKYVMDRITEVLPMPKDANPKSVEDRLRIGVRESIRRHAHVAAYSYANHFLHSAFSPSNETMDGGALDFGAFMSLDGYPRAGRLEDKELNGDLNSVEFVIRQLITSLRQELPRSLVSNVPTIREAISLLREDFNSLLHSEMTAMTGAPPELIELIKKSAAYRNVSETLVAMSYMGNSRRQNALGNGIERTDTYKMEVILPKMAELIFSIKSEDFSSLTEILDQHLEKDIADATLRRTLSKQYVNFVYALSEVASKNGISFKNLGRYMIFQSQIKNRLTRPILAYDGTPKGIAWRSKIDKFVQDGDPTLLRKTLREAIRSSRRTYREAAPMTLVLNEAISPDGSVKREVFNLKTGRISQSEMGASTNNYQKETGRSCPAMLR